MFTRKSYNINEEKKLVEPLIFFDEEMGNFINNIKLDLGNIEELMEKE
jgi:hypothetical protein